MTECLPSRLSCPPREDIRGERRARAGGRRPARCRAPARRTRATRRRSSCARRPMRRAARAALEGFPSSRSRSAHACRIIELDDFGAHPARPRRSDAAPSGALATRRHGGRAARFLPWRGVAGVGRLQRPHDRGRVPHRRRLGAATRCSATSATTRQYRAAGHSFYTVETHIHYLREVDVHEPLALHHAGARRRRQAAAPRPRDATTATPSKLLCTVEQMLVHVDMNAGRSRRSCPTSRPRWTPSPPPIATSGPAAGRQRHAPATAHYLNSGVAPWSSNSPTSTR